MRRLITALWALVKRLWPGAGKSTSPSRPTAANSSSESRITSAETPSDTAPPEYGSSPSSPGSADQLPPVSAKVKPDELVTTTPPSNDERDEPDSVSDDNTSAGKAQETESGPRQIAGRRDRQPQKQGLERRKPPSSHPELICRKDPASAKWEVILSSDEEQPITAVHHEGAPLRLADQRCRVPSLTGRLTVSYQDRNKCDIPLFDNENPLIFKMRKNWDGEGRRISRVTSGHFIFIAPDKWERTGHVPVESDSCMDAGFRAHYFHRDKTARDEGNGGFREWCPPVSSGIDLDGQSVFDDSDEGALFVGDGPSLKPLPDMIWARVGEEAENGWRGKNFRPDEEPLAEVLNGREGRFFLRVYTAPMRMLDSTTFRYLRNLKQALVNGVPYTQDMALTPTSTGHPSAEIRFISPDGATIFPVLPDKAPQTTAQSGAIKVPPRPKADRVECTVGSDASGVNIVLDLPRIWWRMENGSTDPGKWRDTPLIMTRQEFRKRARSNARMSLLSMRFREVHAGFDDELERSYHRTMKEDRIAIPLDHFVDYEQIDRRLNDDIHFNVQWAGKIVPLIQVAADPMPEIVSFTAKPTTISTGQKTILEWITRNAGQARVTIDPAIGRVESHGTCTVQPAATTKYTLTLSASDADDVTRTVTVYSGGGREWRRGTHRRGDPGAPFLEWGRIRHKTSNEK